MHKYVCVSKNNVISFICATYLYDILCQSCDDKPQSYVKQVGTPSGRCRRRRIAVVDVFSASRFILLSNETETDSDRAHKSLRNVFNEPLYYIVF